MENNGNEVTLERIKEVIEDSNLNYKDFARSIGVSRAAIYSWMSGEVGTIKANVLMNIASRYGVSICLVLVVVLVSFVYSLIPYHLNQTL